MRSPRALGYATIMAALLVGRGALADGPAPREAEDLDALLSESIVNTASRSNEVGDVAPATVSTFTGEELRLYGMRSLGEALSFLSLGMVQQSGNASVGARGVLIQDDFNTHVLFLVNGHVINDQQRGTSEILGPGGLPLEIVDRVEVMLGPGSVLYGGNAMLGVVNVITKRAQDDRGLHVVAEGQVAAPVDRERTLLTPDLSSDWRDRAGRSGRLAVGGGHVFDALGTTWDATVEAQYDGETEPQFDFGPPGLERRHFDVSKTYSALARVAGAGLTTTVRALSTDFYRSTPGVFPVRDEGVQGTAGFGGRNTQVNVDARYERRVSASLKLTSRLFADSSSTDANYLTYEGLSSCAVGQFAGCVHSSHVLTRSGGLELIGNFDWNARGTASTMFGATGLARQIGLDLDITEVRTGAPGGVTPHVHTVETGGAAFVEQVLKVGPAITLTAGARLDYEERASGRLSPRLAASFATWKGATAKLIYSEAFRGPTAVESFYFEPLVLQPSTLRPEVVRSAEASFEQRFGAQRIATSLFRTWWFDLIQSVPHVDAPGASDADHRLLEDARARGLINPVVSYVTRMENAGQIDNYGANFSFSGSAVAGRLRYGATATMAQALSAGEAVRLAPRFVGNARVAYIIGDPWPALALAVRTSGRRFVPQPEGDVTREVEKPLETSLRATISGNVPGLRGLSYRVSGDVALNRYTAQAIELPNGAPFQELAPSRRVTVFAGLEYRLP